MDPTPSASRAKLKSRAEHGTELEPSPSPGQAEPEPSRSLGQAGPVPVPKASTSRARAGPEPFPSQISALSGSIIFWPLVRCRESAWHGTLFLAHFGTDLSGTYQSRIGQDHILRPRIFTARHGSLFPGTGLLFKFGMARHGVEHLWNLLHRKAVDISFGAVRSPITPCGAL